MNSKPTKPKSNLIRSASQKVQRVSIGGVDSSDLLTKRAIIQKKIDEAKAESEKFAKEIISTAEQKAKTMVQQAEQQVKALQEEAYKEGYNQGKEDAYQDTMAKLAEILNQSQEVLGSIEKEREEALKDEEERIFRLVVLMTRKLIHRDLSFAPQNVTNLVHKAIMQLEHKAVVNIKVMPEVANALNEVKSQLIREIPGLNDLTITADDSLFPGDLILESNKENLDLRLESQFDEMINEFCNP